MWHKQWVCGPKCCCCREAVQVAALAGNNMDMPAPGRCHGCQCWAAARCLSRSLTLSLTKECIDTSWPAGQVERAQLLWERGQRRRALIRYS